MYQISQVSINRLNSVLQNDKCSNPQFLCEVLKGELQPIISNYIALSRPIAVRFTKTNDKLLFSIEVEAERVRNFGYIPKI